MQKRHKILHKCQKITGILCLHSAVLIKCGITCVTHRLLPLKHLVWQFRINTISVILQEFSKINGSTCHNVLFDWDRFMCTYVDQRLVL